MSKGNDFPMETICCPGCGYCEMNTDDLELIDNEENFISCPECQEDLIVTVIIQRGYRTKKDEK